MVKGDPATEPAEGERKVRSRLVCVPSYDGISKGPWCVGDCGPRFAHANEHTDRRHAVNNTRRRLSTLLAASGLFLLGELAIAAPQNEKKEKKEKKHVHNNGQKMVGSKLKQNGKHEINKKNGHSVSVDVKDGKIAGMQVKHDKKGDVPVKKYKTTKKMAQRGGIQYANYQLAQAQSLGTIYIGYAYIDDWGYEEIYWFPYEMIYDGETGAVDYVPVY